MSVLPSVRAAVTVLGFAGCLIVTAARLALAQAGVSVELLAVPATVAPGALFDLDLVVTQAGSAFNGFSAVIGYDPTALTLVPRSPLALQEGALLREACGNRFHIFRQAAASDTITDVLLCEGVAVTGPGQAYTLHFRAADAPQTTLVRFLQPPSFFNAGLFVQPVFAEDATVVIAGESGVGPVPGSSPAVLRVFPNPCSGPTVLRLDGVSGATTHLRVQDASGREVREFAPSPNRSISWDGRDSRGVPAASGVYFVTARHGDLSLTRRLLIVR